MAGENFKQQTAQAAMWLLLSAYSEHRKRKQTKKKKKIGKFATWSCGKEWKKISGWESKNAQPPLAKEINMVKREPVTNSQDNGKRP